MKYLKTQFFTGILIFLWGTHLFTQAPDTLWTRAYGGSFWDDGYSVKQLPDSGYIIAGLTYSFGAGSKDVYILRTDKNGDTLWTKTYGGIDDDFAYSVNKVLAGGFIVGGETYSFSIGGSDIWILRINDDGDTLWTKTYGGSDDEGCWSIKQTMDGGFIISGWTYSFGAGITDIYLIKTNAGGDVIWTKIYGGAERDQGCSVEQTSDGGYIIVGMTESFGSGDADVYFLKTDSLGDTLWTKTYGGDSADCCNSVKILPNTGYILSGWSRSFGSGENDFYLIKTDMDGNTIWEKTYGGVGYDWGFSLQVTTDSGYIIVGETTSFGHNVYCIKTDENGDTIWTKTYGGQFPDRGVSIEKTFDGGYIIVGTTMSFGPGFRSVYLVKTEPDPTIVEEQEDIGYKKQNMRISIAPNPFTTSTTITLYYPSTGHPNGIVDAFHGTSNAEGIEENTSAQCQVPSDREDIALHIYDISGRLIKSVPLTTNHLSLGTDLSPGIYFLKLNDKPVGKVVKVR